MAYTCVYVQLINWIIPSNFIKLLFFKLNNQKFVIYPKVTELEISGYVSDGEIIGDTLSSSRLSNSESLPLQTDEGSRRSVSDWVRFAQTMLQTPQKPFDRESKTPEDSAKKKRKFQRFELCFCF